MVTRQELADIKKELSLEHDFIHEFKVDKYTFLFRPLTIDELTLPSRKKISQIELEDLYIEWATLYPTDINWAKIKAGYVTQYIEEILVKSGFNNLGVINEMLERHRDAAQNNIINTMKSYIITAMPAYKEEDLVDLSMEEFTRLMVLAEEIITIQQQISGFETSGFKIVISSVDGSEDEIEMTTEKVAPKQPNQTLSKEDEEKMRKRLIAQIRQANAEIMDTTSNPADFESSWLEDLDINSLKTIAGVTKENDPLADILAQSERQAGR